MGNQDSGDESPDFHFSLSASIAQSSRLGYTHIWINTSTRTLCLRVDFDFGETNSKYPLDYAHITIYSLCKSKYIYIYIYMCMCIAVSACDTVLLISLI